MRLNLVVLVRLMLLTMNGVGVMVKCLVCKKDLLSFELVVRACMGCGNVWN